MAFVTGCLVPDTGRPSIISHQPHSHTAIDHLSILRKKARGNCRTSKFPSQRASHPCNPHQLILDKLNRYTVSRQTMLQPG